MRRVTSHDVARLAGVSQPTVSRALRADPLVATATRERVRRAAEQLAYVPSRRGRNLSTRATGQVAIVVGDLANPFYMEAIGHLHGALHDAGLRAVVLTDPVEAADLLDGAVDGAVLTTVRLGSALPADLTARGLPCVLMNRTLDDPPVDTCASDNAAGAGELAGALAALGHERIAAVLGPPDTTTGRDRERGFRAALEHELVAEHHGSFSFTTGQDGLRAVLAARPTAVFCGNDVIAVGALNAARALGIDVPRELTVVGFDDIAMAAWPVFSLTTARQDLAAMAHETVGLLVDRMAMPSLPPRHRVIRSEVVLRGTHGPA